MIYIYIEGPCLEWGAAGGRGRIDGVVAVIGGAAETKKTFFILFYFIFKNCAKSQVVDDVDAVVVGLLRGAVPCRELEVVTGAVQVVPQGV